MRLPWIRREQKRRWALNNPDKVRWANQRWRSANESKIRRQARERMRRWRAKRVAQPT